MLNYWNKGYNIYITQTSAPQNLNQLINIQAGSVVSKELLTKPSGNITLFAFDQGEGLSEHTAPYDAFVLIVDGSIEIKLAGDTFIVNQGESLVMTANSPHSLKALTPLKMILVMIKS